MPTRQRGRTPSRSFVLNYRYLNGRYVRQSSIAPPRPQPPIGGFYAVVAKRQTLHLWQMDIMGSNPIDRNQAGLSIGDL